MAHSGSFTAFRAAWEPQRQPEQLVRDYHLRDQGDPDHIISFGLFDLTAAEFDALFELLVPIPEGVEHE